jgi:putative N-acetyltransferase (TIGR04045 family)
MIAAPPREAVATACRIATAEREVAAYFALRRRIFCDEQGLFPGDDRDAWDAVATPIVCVAREARGDGRVVGVVRIYEESRDLWYGGRLGVDAAHRRGWTIGRSLIVTAVTTAHARGCRRFLATVQLANVRFFERLHWRALGHVEAHGVPHQLMEADLGHYPAARP